MSIELMAKAWKLPIPATEKMVLLCLCDYANGQGTCWPGAESMAGRCSLTERTVRKALKWLEEHGYITADARPGKTAIYHINPGSKFTPEANSPRKMTPQPRKQIPDTPEAGSDEPSRNHHNHQSSSSSGDDGALKPHHFVEAWNDLASDLGKPKVRDLTPERRTRLKARIAGYSLDDFRTVLVNIRGSPFLRGDKQWQGCTFDWVTRKANFQKILEGNYNDQPTEKPSGRNVIPFAAPG